MLQVAPQAAGHPLTSLVEGHTLGGGRDGVESVVMEAYLLHAKHSDDLLE